MERNRYTDNGNHFVQCIRDNVYVASTRNFHSGVMTLNIHYLFLSKEEADYRQFVY